MDASTAATATSYDAEFLPTGPSLLELRHGAILTAIHISNKRKQYREGIIPKLLVFLIYTLC